MASPNPPPAAAPRRPARRSRLDYQRVKGARRIVRCHDRLSAVRAPSSARTRYTSPDKPRDGGRCRYAARFQDSRAQAAQERAVVRHEDDDAFELAHCFNQLSPRWPGPGDWSARRAPGNWPGCRACAPWRAAISHRPKANPPLPAMASSRTERLAPTLPVRGKGPQGNSTVSVGR